MNNTEKKPLLLHNQYSLDTLINLDFESFVQHINKLEFGIEKYNYLNRVLFNLANNINNNNIRDIQEKKIIHSIGLSEFSDFKFENVSKNLVGAIVCNMMIDNEYKAHLLGRILKTIIEHSEKPKDISSKVIYKNFLNTLNNLQPSVLDINKNQELMKNLNQLTQCNIPMLKSIVSTNDGQYNLHKIINIFSAIEDHLSIDSVEPLSYSAERKISSCRDEVLHHTLLMYFQQGKENLKINLLIWGYIRELQRSINATDFHNNTINQLAFYFYPRILDVECVSNLSNEKIKEKPAMKPLSDKVNQSGSIDDESRETGMLNRIDGLVRKLDTLFAPRDSSTLKNIIKEIDEISESLEQSMQKK